MLSGELLPAESFIGSGLVHTIAESETLIPTVSALADQLSKAGGQVHDRVKRLLRSGHDTPSELQLATELTIFAEHWQQSDITGELTRFITRRRG